MDRHHILPTGVRAPSADGADSGFMDIYNIQNWVFYTIKPVIPRPMQLFVRRQIARYRRQRYAPIWPIDPNSTKPPEGWQGWPESKQFALVLSHDVDSIKGYHNTLKLAELEENLGFRSTFNFVPERYGKISLSLIHELRKRGFGVGIHGLKHDGKLFLSKKIFLKQAARINAYIREWNVRGFTSPSMHHNLGWMGALDIDFSISTFDTDPFEPQPDGVGTIFPFWVATDSHTKGFVEMPYTLPQDSTLFVILQEKTIGSWKQKVDWIAQNGGMILVNTHPDYMKFDRGDLGSEEYPLDYYIQLLEHIRSCNFGGYWHPLCSEMAVFWKARYSRPAGLTPDGPTV